MPCWMLQKREVCFVHLGKFGDLMIMLPAFKAVADEMGHPPVCMVSTDYASLFEGVSYVRPWVVALHWWRGVGLARKMAEQVGFNPIMVKWWDEPGVIPPKALEPPRNLNLTIHGRHISVNAKEWDSYQASQWRFAGFTMEQMMEWPLVFDRRNPGREAKLRAHHFKTTQPKLLVNMPEAGASPFKMAHLIRSYIHGYGFEIIDLSKVKAAYIFDLLGLYDGAQCLITSDTATLHLAAASKIPFIALINDGGAGSIPRGNCVLKIRYSEAPHRRAEIIKALNQARSKQ